MLYPPNKNPENYLCYRLKGRVENSDNQQYVNLGNLMCKDIYYANKRNAFVFNDEARKLSKEENQLVLLCIWFEPLIKNGVFQQERGIEKEEYIRLKDLNLDYETYKPFYIDADILFFKYQPELKTLRKKTEAIVIDAIRKIEKRRDKEELIRKGKEEKIKEIKELLKEGKAKLTRLQKKEKWGFECMGETVIEPTYSEATEISEDGYAIVKRRNKYGLINKIGEEVIRCSNDVLINIFKEKFIVKEKKSWIYIDLKIIDNIIIVNSKNNTIQLEKIGENAYKIKIDNYLGIANEKYGLNQYDNIESYKNGIAKAVRIRKDEQRKESIIYEYGYIDEQGNEIIPFEYNEIGELIGGKAIAEKNGMYGYIDEKGNVIIPFEYGWIREFINGKAIAEKNGMYGCIDEQGNVIVDFKYDQVEEFINGKAKAWKNDKGGYIDEQCNELIIDVTELKQKCFEGKKI
jgi:hypothetical protein